MRTLINDIIDRLRAGTIGAMALMASFSVVAQSQYYDPDHPGHGVSVSQDTGQGSALIWYLYNRAGDPRWLITTDNCTEYPCQTGLAESAGAWMGGDFELVEVGSVSVDFIDGDLYWQYNLSAWPESGDCGRMVWLYQTRCIGEFKMKAID